MSTLKKAGSQWTTLILIYGNLSSLEGFRGISIKLRNCSAFFSTEFPIGRFEGRRKNFLAGVSAKCI